MLIQNTSKTLMPRLQNTTQSLSFGINLGKQNLSIRYHLREYVKIIIQHTNDKWIVTQVPSVKA